MKGIVGYAAYLPAYRIARDAIAAAWQERSLGGSRCAIRFDEDTLTMAAAAAQACLATLPGCQPSALYFASTTAPFAECSNAGLIAAVCDLEEACATADFSSSLRAVTTALKLALETSAGATTDTALI